MAPISRDGSAMNSGFPEKKRADEFDLNDVTHNSPLDEAQTEQEDQELDMFEDQMGDDLDLQKDDFESETFHDVQSSDAP